MFRPLASMRTFRLCTLSGLLLLLAATGCSLLPVSLPGGTVGGGLPGKQATFDGPVTLKIAAGDSLPGTNVAYLGKTADGRANVTMGGLAAPKKAGDSLNWSGAPTPFTLATLDSRVLTFDDSALNLLGTVHIVIKDPAPQIGREAPTAIAEFTIAPVTYNLARKQTLAGTTIQYVGRSPQQGAEFSGIEGFPFRQQFDSFVWEGHVREKVFLRLDTRVVNYNDTSADLAGTLTIRFEP